MHKVICFTRVSTTMQDLESQEREVIAMAKGDGYKENQIILISEKESGYCLDEDERIGITQMKKAIEEQTIDCVYCWEVSRIARRLKIVVSISDYLKERKVNLKTRKEGFSIFDYSGNLNPFYTVMMAMLGSFAEMERNTLIERTQRTKRQRMQEGYATNTNKPKYGYSINAKRKFEVNEEEASIVREIFTLYASGKYSSKAIATMLNERGIKYKQTKTSKVARGNELGLFTAHVVNGIIRCEAYKGTRSKDKTYAKEHNTIGHLYPSIVSEELFDECQAMSKSKNVGNNAKDTTKVILFGKSLLKDIHDILPNGKGRTLLQRIPIMLYQNSENKTGVNINYVDFILWEVAKMLRSKTRINASEIEAINGKIEIENQKLIVCNDKLKKNDARLKKITDAFAKGAYDGNEEIYFGIVGNCKNEKKEIIESIKVIETNIENLKKVLKKEAKKNIVNDDIFANFSDKEKYDLIHQMIKEVLVDKQGNAKVSMTIIFAYNEELRIEASFESKKNIVIIDGKDVSENYKPRFERKKY